MQMSIRGRLFAGSVELILSKSTLLSRGERNVLLLKYRCGNFCAFVRQGFA